MIAATSRPTHWVEAEVEKVLCSLDDLEQLGQIVRRSRVVVHLATASTPGSSAGQPLAELDGNLRPTLGLLEVLQSNPSARLVYLSSGGSLYSAGADGCASEVTAVAPRSYHGAGKIAAEHFIHAWSRQYGGAAVILRPSNLYGPGQPERRGFGIVPAGFGKVLDEGVLTIWGDGSAMRDYLYIDDFIALCMNVITSPIETGVCTFNASSGIGVSLNDLLVAIEEVCGKPLRRTYDTSRAVDVSRVVIDATAARQAYGWSATTTLAKGLRQTWSWLQSQC